MGNDLTNVVATSEVEGALAGSGAYHKQCGGKANVGVTLFCFIRFTQMLKIYE